MFLHRLYPDPRYRNAMRDLANPYAMHQTLSRAMADGAEKVAPGSFMWLLDQRQGRPVVLLQTAKRNPRFSDMDRVERWLAKNIEPPMDLSAYLGSMQVGQSWRFRLRATPSVLKRGSQKRTGLLTYDTQLDWLVRQGKRHGFRLFATSEQAEAWERSKARGDMAQVGPNVMISESKALVGSRVGLPPIQVNSVLYDGVLVVEDVDKLRAAVFGGIGHTKVLGLGLLLIAPIS